MPVAAALHGHAALASAGDGVALEVAFGCNPIMMLLARVPAAREVAAVRRVNRPARWAQCPAYPLQRGRVMRGPLSCRCVTY
jgi:uncharacterized protein (DUF1501 family)